MTTYTKTNNDTVTYEYYITNSKSWIPNLRELWHYRLLLIALLNRNIKLRYKQTLLGYLWVILQPLALSGTFAIIFGKLIEISTGKVPYTSFVLTGVLLWQMFNRAILDSSSSLVNFSNVITKVYFPRILVPMASILTSLFDFLIVFPVVFILQLLFYGSIPLHFIWAGPLFIIMALVFSIGIGLLISSINALFRDLQHVVPFLLQLGLYISPVAYPLSVIPDRWKFIYSLNPMVSFIEGFRWSLLPESPFPDGTMLVIACCVSFIMLITGCIVFSVSEKCLVDRI